MGLSSLEAMLPFESGLYLNTVLPSWSVPVYVCPLSSRPCHGVASGTFERGSRSSCCRVGAGSTARPLRACFDSTPEIHSGCVAIRGGGGRGFGSLWLEQDWTPVFVKFGIHTQGDRGPGMQPGFPRAKNVIVIGGGIAGTSIMRALAAKGVGVTLLEKAGQLCAGATWHAAGLVTRFGGSPKIKKIHVRALREMIDLHESHDVRARTPSRHILHPARQTSCAAL